MIFILLIKFLRNIVLFQNTGILNVNNITTIKLILFNCVVNSWFFILYYVIGGGGILLKANKNNGSNCQNRPILLYNSVFSCYFVCLKISVYWIYAIYRNSLFKYVIS